MNAENRQLIVGITDCPESMRALVPFFASLKEKGMSPQTATIDGNTHVFKALRAIWPKITIQRCLVHIQRQGLSWCRERPKRTDAKKLRMLLLRVSKIHTHDKRRSFLNDLGKWEAIYGHRIESTSRKGWVSTDLQQARKMLLRAVPFMFHYLDEPKIPNTTNALEGYYARLKDKYRQHRGLSPKHQNAFFQWYVKLQLS